MWNDGTGAVHSTSPGLSHDGQEQTDHVGWFWPRLAPVVVSSVVMVWPACGSVLANRSGLPKYHRSTQDVGRMDVFDAGQIWATVILPAGTGLEPEPGWTSCPEWLDVIQSRLLG